MHRSSFQTTPPTGSSTSTLHPAFGARSITRLQPLPPPPPGPVFSLEVRTGGHAVAAGRKIYGIDPSRDNAHLPRTDKDGKRELAWIMATCIAHDLGPVNAARIARQFGLPCGKLSNKAFGDYHSRCRQHPEDYTNQQRPALIPADFDFAQCELPRPTPREMRAMHALYRQHRPIDLPRFSALCFERRIGVRASGVEYWYHGALRDALPAPAPSSGQASGSSSDAAEDALPRTLKRRLDGVKWTPNVASVDEAVHRRFDCAEYGDEPSEQPLDLSMKRPISYSST